PLSLHAALPLGLHGTSAQRGVQRRLGSLSCRCAVAPDQMGGSGPAHSAGNRAKYSRRDSVVTPSEARCGVCHCTSIRRSWPSSSTSAVSDTFDASRWLWHID